MKYAVRWFALLLAVMVMPCLGVAVVQGSASCAWYPAGPDGLRSVLLSACLLALVAPVYGCMPSARPRLWLGLATAISVVLVPVAVTGVIHALLFKIPVNFYAIQAVLETSPSEVAQALDTLFNPGLLLAAVGMVALQVVVIRWGYKALAMRGQGLTAGRTRWRVLLAYIAVVLALGVLVARSPVSLETNRLLRSHVLSRTVIECRLALRFQATTRELTKQTRQPVDFGPMQLVDGAARRTYVVILGESASRHHLGLYGYPRPTTHPLADLKDQLVIWHEVVSMFGMTSPSLNEALLFRDLGITQGVPSMLALHREAGFRTFWLTNTTSNTLTGATWFDMAADTYVRTNVATRFVLPTPFDETLLPELEKALADEAPNKFIVIHLAGSHFNYKYRYPEDSAIFESHDKTNMYRHDKLSKAEVEMINEYDNSIHYTSTIIKNMIDRVRQHDTSSYVLYLSDHGQQLFETEGSFQAQHAIGETRYMYDVPFFAWFSERYRHANPEFINGLVKNTQKFVKLDDSFCHGLADLSRIHFPGLRYEKSVFSEKYVEPGTMLGGQVDYSRLLK